MLGGESALTAKKSLTGTVPEVEKQGVLGTTAESQNGCYVKLLSSNE